MIQLFIVLKWICKALHVIYPEVVALFDHDMTNQINIDG